MAIDTYRPSIFSKKPFFVFIGVAVILWAFAFPFIKIGLSELSPINLTIMRLAIVCIVFLLLLVCFPKKFIRIRRQDIVPIFLLGFFGIVVYHLGLNYGEQYISASAASLIIATIPVFVIILAVFFLEEIITKKILVGIFLCFSGVALISVTGTPQSTLEIRYLSGAITTLIAALVGAGYTIAGKKLLQNYSALSLTVYAFLFGSIGLIPFLSPSLVVEVVSLSRIGWGAILFLALFPTVIAYILWFMVLEMRNASEVSIYLYFIPVLSTTISAIFLDERITFFFLVGGCLVIAGLLVVNKYKKKKTTQKITPLP